MFLPIRELIIEFTNKIAPVAAPNRGIISIFYEKIFRFDFFYSSALRNVYTSLKNPIMPRIPWDELPNRYIKPSPSSSEAATKTPDPVEIIPPRERDFKEDIEKILRRATFGIVVSLQVFV